MGHDRGRPPWAEAMRNVARTGWPVLLPIAVAVLGPALGAQGVFARTAPVLVVVAGSALLPPPRFAALCLTTLVCAAVTWTGPSAGVFMVLLAEAVLTVPFVVAGRALWLTRRDAGARRLRSQSTLIVRVAARQGQPIQPDRNRSS